MVLPLTPTEYFERNCWVGVQLPRRARGRRRCSKLGAAQGACGDRDYPHNEGTSPVHPREPAPVVPRLGSRGPASRMLAGTAADVYGFDLDVLDPIAARVRSDGRGGRRAARRDPEGRVQPRVLPLRSGRSGPVPPVATGTTGTTRVRLAACRRVRRHHAIGDAWWGPRPESRPGPRPERSAPYRASAGGAGAERGESGHRTARSGCVPHGTEPSVSEGPAPGQPWANPRPSYRPGAPGRVLRCGHDRNRHRRRGGRRGHRACAGRHPVGAGIRHRLGARRRRGARARRGRPPGARAARPRAAGPRRHRGVPSAPRAPTRRCRS